MIRFFSAVLLVGWISVCNAQNLNHSIRNYTAIDGLPQSQVDAIVEDSNGYLWIGTKGGGLAMFDGRQFKVYSTIDGLLSNFVNGLRIDHDKNLWILHPRGLTKFDGLKFTKFHFPGWTHPKKNYRSLISVDESIYVFSEEGLTKIKNDSTYYWDKPIGNGKKVWAPFQTPTGELCFYLDSNEILVYSDDEEYTIPVNVDGELSSIFRHDNEQWLQFRTGIYKLNISNRTLDKVPLNLKHVVKFYDAKNDVYWTRDREHFYREVVKDGQIEVDTILKDVAIMQVLPDAEGNVWFASDGSGLFKYYYQDFDRCASENLKGVMAIHVDKNGTSWIGTMSKGLWSIKQGKVTSYVFENDYQNMINDIGESPDGTLWIATPYGLGKLNKTTQEFDWNWQEKGPPLRYLRGFNFDEKGGMWLAAAEGVIYYNDKDYRKFTAEDGLKADMASVVSYLPGAKTLFVGTEFGLNTIKDGKVGTIAIPELDNTLVLGLHPYRDSLMLVGTGGSGVLIFDPKSYKRKLITRRDGLTSDFVYFVTADHDDVIWVGTEKGITRLKLNDQWEIIENLHYDDANGLTGIETNQGAYFISDKHKYFGLVDGLYEFNDLSDVEAKSFDLHLTDVEIFYGDYSARDFSDSLAGFFKIPINPVLPSDKNHITFHFNRVDKRYPKSVRFRYLLQNFDKTWSQPSASTQVTYSNLPPGDYAFRVMATNNEGSWAEDKIMYTFTVKAPFYQTASFITGVIIFIAGSITLLMYLRVRQKVRKMIETERIRMREQESLRKEIARDFHDEMGNQLTRIINYVSLLKLNVNGNSETHGLNGINRNGHHPVHSHYDLYAKVEESAKVLYTGTRDFIWSIDPVNDELSKLFVHIRDFGEKLFEEKDINFRAYDEVKERLKLPHGFSREANLIFKEAMTNAFKYSKAQNVTFVLRKIENRFEMAFEDDGVGFCTDHVGKSNGLKNIRERTNRIGAVLRIHSDIGKGTRITLDFKLTKTLKYGNAI